MPQKTKVLCCVFVFSCALVFTGCATTAKKEQAAQIEALNQRVSELSGEHQALFMKIQDLEKQVVPLKADVAGNAEALTQTTQKIALLEEEVKALQKPAEKPPEPPEKKKPAAKMCAQKMKPQKMSAKALYDQGKKALFARDYDASEKAFTRFLEEHPDHTLADNAAYWVGEIYYDSGRYEKAAPAFQAVVEAYPEEPKAPDALYKLALTYLKLNDPKSAKEALERLVLDYPFSPLVKTAQDKLEELE